MNIPSLPYSPPALIVDTEGKMTNVRQEVAEFAAAMEVKLRKNDHKSTWRDKPIEALKRLLLLEIEEFKVAHEFFSLTEAMDELCDIGNYAMILRDRLHIEQDKQVSPGLDAAITDELNNPPKDIIG